MWPLCTSFATSYDHKIISKKKFNGIEAHLPSLVLLITKMFNMSLQMEFCLYLIKKQKFQ